jgi:hypothetical protein
MKKLSLIGMILSFGLLSIAQSTLDLKATQKSGNVAEMIAEKGKTIGGNWLDNADVMIIGSTGKYSSYTTPHPTIGFRYVMDIIEE